MLWDSVAQCIVHKSDQLSISRSKHHVLHGNYNITLLQLQHNHGKHKTRLSQLFILSATGLDLFICSQVVIFDLVQSFLLLHSNMETLTAPYHSYHHHGFNYSVQCGSVVPVYHMKQLNLRLNDTRNPWKKRCFPFMGNYVLSIFSRTFVNLVFTSRMFRGSSLSYNWFHIKNV